METGRFRVVLMSSFEPRPLTRLITRLEEEMPEVTVCGILYEPWKSKTLRRRIRNFLRNLPKPGYLAYVGDRLRHRLFTIPEWLKHTGMWLLHGYRGRAHGLSPSGLADLADFCKARGCALHFTKDLHAPDALAFVRNLKPDLGIVYGTRILQPALFDIPRLGSINIHKRQLPDYRGGGPIGLWEMLDGRSEIGVTVHRVTARVDEGQIIRSAAIPIEPYDNLRSLSLKADVVAGDLLIGAVASFMNGTVKERPQLGRAATFRNPPPQELRRYEKKLSAQRPRYTIQRGRPTWKLLLRTLALAPYIAVRNWYRRFRRSFPVVVLYHHVVTDRPHPLGIPTDLFMRQVEYLRKYYRVADLDDALQMAKSGAVDAPTIVLTFDDGYKDNYLNLRAVTEALEVPVTLFVCTEKITTQEEFEHDRSWGLTGFLPLTWEEVKRLERCHMRVGSHTRSHLDCGSTDLALLEREIAGSKADLETHLGHPVSYFSFPRGLPANISPASQEVAKRTYAHICSAFGGANCPQAKDELWHVRRCYHPNNLWELELMLQSVLDF